MIRKIRRTPQARRDIIGIYVYLYQRSPAAAEKVLNAIERTIRGLGQFPGVGNRWMSNHPSLQTMRYTTITGYRNYLVFFGIAGKVVEIFRVVHAFRDLSQVVDEIEP